MATEDFELYYDLVRALTSFGIPFETVSPRRRIPGRISVVVTSEREYPHIRHSNKVSVRCIEEAIVLARSMDGREGAEHLNVGIDPGEHVGVAVVSARGRALLLLTAHSVDDTVSVVSSIIGRRDRGHVSIKVGGGAPTIRDRIITSLRALGLDVYIVDESGTSLSTRRSGSDELAAFRISMLPGEKALDLPSSMPTPGEIRDIQRKSRILSSGRITIPRDMALSVALGEKSLHEAVRAYGRSGRKRR